MDDSSLYMVYYSFYIDLCSFFCLPFIYSFFSLFWWRACYSNYSLMQLVFVSPAKQKRDICIAFPASSLSSSSSSAA